MAYEGTREDTSDYVTSEPQSNAASSASADVLPSTNVELPITESPVERESEAKWSEVVVVNTADRKGSFSPVGSETTSKQQTWEPWTQQEKAGNPSSRDPRPWKTTLLRAGPISGIFSMFLAIASIFACLGILEGSNGVAVDSWSVQPSLYLAIFVAIANLAMRYACIQGIVIAWWMRALRGSTVSKLHWDWRSGTTLIGALTGGRQMGWFGLACIFSTLVTVDGPLLQRATHVVRAPKLGEFVQLDITIAAEVPRSIGGHWVRSKAWGAYEGWSLSFNKTIPTIDGTAPNDIWPIGFVNITDRIVRQANQDGGLVGAIRGCPGECRATLRAPAFSTACVIHQIPVNYTQPNNAAELKNAGTVAPPLDRQSFLVTTSLLEGVNEAVNLVTGWSSIDRCVGVFNYRVCTLTSAVGEYNVSVSGDKVTLENAAHPTILALANNTQADHSSPLKFPGCASTFAPIVEWMFAQWESYVAVYNNQGNIQTALRSENVADQYAILTGVEDGCISYSDPYEDIMADLNRLMVFTGIQGAHGNASYLELLPTLMDPGWPINTTTVGLVVGEHNVYKSEFRFFIAAALVELVCILLVAPAYWGFWRLGRPCSFSPLEIAKAFESPLLTEVNSNSSGRDLAKTVGEVRVRYGATRQYGMPEKSKLAFANPVLVDQPEKGVRFDL